MAGKPDPIQYATPVPQPNSCLQSLRAFLRAAYPWVLVVALLFLSYKPIGRAVNDWLSSIFLNP